VQSGPGIPDRDKNARLSVDRLIKYGTFRSFLAPFKERELRRPVVLTFSFKVDTFRVRFRNEISLDIKES
jgi:hypothetical protein